MKNTTIKLAIIGALFFTCLAPGSFAKEKYKHDHGKSGIAGQIVQMPGPWYIRIDTEKDQLVEVIQAEEDGSFDVDLKAGTYILTPFYLSIDGTGELVGVAQTVTVEKKEFTEVELLIVHGPD